MKGQISVIIGCIDHFFALSLFCILQFSFRSKEKYDKKHKHRLGEVDEGHESNDSDQPSKVESMSNADVDLYLEQMLVGVISQLSCYLMYLLKNAELETSAVCR